MAGQMGNRQRTIQNLQVVAADEERGLIFIKGGLPGSKGSWVSLKDAVKKALPSEAPYPAGIKGANNVKIDDQNSKVEEKSVKEETAKLDESVAETSAKETVKAESQVEKVVTETPAHETPTSEVSANAEDNKKKED